MILTASQARLVQEGKKTRITRPLARELAATVGDRTPVQIKSTLKDDWTGKRTERRITRCYVIVDYVVSTQLYLATEADARQEGYRSRDEWFDDWKETYGHRPEVMYAGAPVPVDTPVVVYVVRVDTSERQRFLSTPIAGKQGDYTESPARAIDEIEAVGDEWLSRFTTSKWQLPRRRAA